MHHSDYCSKGFSERYSVLMNPSSYSTILVSSFKPQRFTEIEKEKESIMKKLLFSVVTLLVLCVILVFYGYTKNYSKNHQPAVSEQTVSFRSSFVMLVNFWCSLGKIIKNMVDGVRKRELHQW